MGDRKDWALERFGEGFSCSQAVLASHSGELGLDEQAAFRVAGAFGGGMGHTDGACGAVTGALMLIGLKYGKCRKDDTVSKDRTYAKVKEFVEAFKAKRGSVRCSDLVKFDLSDPDQLARARASGVFSSVCPLLIADAIELAEKLLA